MTTGGKLTSATDCSAHFIEYTNERAGQSTVDDTLDTHFESPRIPTGRDLVGVIATHRGVRHRHFSTLQPNESVSTRNPNGSASSIVDWARKSGMDAMQQRTFEVLASTFVLTFFDDAGVQQGQQPEMPELECEHRNLIKLSGRNGPTSPLVAFIHGPGGSGKTTAIDLVKRYCEEFCNYLKYAFTADTLVMTALTGVAATLLLGDTVHKAVHLNQKLLYAEQVERWKLARMLIIDEISFAAPDLFIQLDQNLRSLREKHFLRYGGLSLVFCGDLRQIKAVKQASIVDERCAQFDEWINCYIELEGLHRFQEDPEWGRMLLRFHNGVPLLRDFYEINRRVVKDGTDVPDDIQYATSVNMERDSINTAVFEKHCIESAAQNGGIAVDSNLLFSDQIKVHKGDKEKSHFVIDPFSGKLVGNPRLKLQVKHRKGLTLF